MGEEGGVGAADGDMSPVLEAMEVDELAAFRELLDQRVRGGKATLEDFGHLARVHEDLARRGTVERGSTPE